VLAHRRVVPRSIVLGGLGLCLWPTAAWADTGLAAPESAQPLERGHLESGLFSNTYYGLSDRLQLGLHPLLCFVLPHAELKVSWWRRGSAYLATVHRLAYPRPFLRLVAREGSAGLLPANSDVPHSLQTQNDVWITTTRIPGQSLSAWLGVSKALVGSSAEFPLLDFPFLYQRFADLHAPWVARAGVALEGHLARSVYYSFDTRGWLFRLDEPELAAAVVESTLVGGWEPRSDWRVALGLKSALGNFPIGVRMHLLPFVDVRHAF